jgi:thiol-disulfide isomerase/thioredoxin
MMMRFLAATALVATLTAPALADVKAGDRGDFEGQALSGQSFKLSSLRGKVVLIDFWASWCEPCKKELPLLAKMAPKLRSEGIELVTVNIDDDRKNAQSFLSEHGLSLTVIADSDKHIVGKFEPAKMPSSFAVDKQGVVRAVNAGFQPGDESKLERQLLDLTKK